MAGNIKGITIEIGGSTTKLQSALKEVNSKSKDLAGELRSVEKLLKFDPKNTELLAQKQKLLGESIGTVSEKLATLKEAQKQVDAQFAKGEISEEQYRALQREIISTEGYLKNLESQLKDTNQKWEDFGKKAQEIGSKTSEMGKKLAPVSAVAAGVGVAITKMASDFEDSMAKVSTIADTAEVPIGTLKKSILDLSSQTGISANEIANNVYDAISAGQKTGDAVAFVQNSTKLAKAGFAEAGQSLDLLTTIMNSYGLESEKVGEVSDMLIQVQNKGKVTVGELSSAMGKIIPTANSMGIGLDQIGAGYAILTSKGIKAAEATTYMNSMLNEMGKTGSKTDKDIRALTGSGFKELIEKGMTVTDVLGLLDENAKKNGNSLSDMFGSAEAAKAALVLLGEDASVFNNMVGEMNSSLGATETAFEKLQTPGEKMSISLNKLKNVGIELGIVLLPIVTQIAEGIASVVDKFSQLDESTKVIIVGVIAFVAALAPLLIIVGHVISAVGVISTAIGALIPILSGAAAGTGALGTVFTVLTGPIGLIIAAVAALVAAFVYLWNNNEEFKTNVLAIWEEIQKYLSVTLEKLGKFFSETFGAIKSIVLMIFGELKVFWNTWGSSIKAIFGVFLEGFKVAFNLAFITIKTIVATIFGAIKIVIDTTLKIISTIVRTVLDTIKGLFKVALQLISGDWSGAWETLKNTFINLWSGIKTVISTALDGVGQMFNLLKTNAVNWGKNMIGGFVDGIKSMIGKVKDAASSVTKAAAEFLGFNSPAKKGAGRFIVDYGQNMIGGFLDGVKKAIPDVSSVVGGVTQTAGKALTASTNNNYSGGSVVVNMYNPQVADKASIASVSRQLQQTIANNNRALGVVFNG